MRRRSDPANGYPRPVKRLVLAAVAGAAIGCFAAVTLGEYPLTGWIPWLACVIVPGAMGTAMTAIAGSHRRAFWAATGPLSAASLAWGVGISTSWGIDPVPAAGWAEMSIGLAWPVAWALVSGRQGTAAAELPEPDRPGREPGAGQPVGAE